MNGQDTFHTLGFFSALGIAAADAQVNAIKEQPFNVDNANKFVVPDTLYLWGAYYAAASAIRARINTASRRIRGFPQIQPFNRSLFFSANKMPVMDFAVTPLRLEALENIEIDGSNNLGAATESSYAILFVGRNVPPNETPPALARWVRFTAAVTIVQGTWATPVVLSAVDQLEGGHYMVWGMTCVCVGAIAARLIFPRGMLYKPGCIAQTAFGLYSDYFFLGDRIGHWGDFDTYAFPQVEVLGDTAGAQTAEIMLLIAKD